MIIDNIIDPGSDSLLEEMRAFNETLAESFAGSRGASMDPLEYVKALREGEAGMSYPGSPNPNARNVTIDGPMGQIGLRILAADTVNAVYLDIHGGGFFMGSPTMDDGHNWALAEAIRRPIFSPNLPVWKTAGSPRNPG